MLAPFKFIQIKEIPVKSWSSPHSFNLKPKVITLFYLFIGLLIFGFGEGLILVSSNGNSPWLVFAEGLTKITGLTVGGATFLISVTVLLLWIFLSQKPGIGTIMNIFIIAAVIDLTSFLIDPPSNYFLRYSFSIVGVFLVGLGSGFYLIANLGPGPRDGLMTGLNRISHLPIALIRASIEITVVLIGWYLGGTVGVGTLIFAFGIGPSVALGLTVVKKI